MNSKVINYLFLFFVVFASITLVYSNQINYDLTTKYPSTAPYFVGTFISDLKVSFVDSNNHILDQSKISNLKVKIGSKTFNLKKDKDKAYHLRNYTITNDLVKDNKLSISVLTPLEGKYSNTKQTYPIGNIKDNITVKNNPKESYKNLTVGEPVTLNLVFDNLKNEDISNMNCDFQKRGKNAFKCDGDLCTHSFTVPKDLNNIKIFCNFDKDTSKAKKTLPLFYNIDVTLSEGIKLGAITNPKDGVIGNPFELCFNLLYENKDSVKDLTSFKMKMNKESVDVYKRGNSFCVTKFLVPYTKLDKNIDVVFLGNDYKSKISVGLKPGKYWTWFFIIFILFVLLNIGLILRAVLSKETYEDLVEKADKYNSKLKVLKEEYLKGDITKKEFDSKLNENSIKLSYINEKLLRAKKKKKKTEKPRIVETKTYDASHKKAPNELMNAIFSENPSSNNKPAVKPVTSNSNINKGKEIVKIKDDDLYVADVGNSAIPKEPELTPKKKEPSKFILFFKNMFKRKHKKPKKKEKQYAQANTQGTMNLSVQGDDLDFKPETLDNDDFNIKNWQK